MPVEAVERAVERAYSRVRLPQAQAKEIRAKLDRAIAGMRTQAGQEAAPQRRRLDKLATEREKLLHAYYAGAVPLDLLKDEQGRLASETAQAECHLEQATTSIGDVQETLAKALDLLANCARAYRTAPGHLRRQWNQALFERFLALDDDLTEAELAEPFATIARSAANETAAPLGGGSNEASIVGATGFEPATFRPPAECATRLRHAPWLCAET